MKKLSLPEVDDETNWRRVASNKRIRNHRLLTVATKRILARYALYHGSNGDLAGLNTVRWSEPLKHKLAKLYSKPPMDLTFLAQQRKSGSAIVCPMCGSSHTSSLDHVLPKADFPEFYIYSRNLVPACPCNSLRGENYVGSRANERILHPYYDRILTRRLVRARLEPPFPRPKISILVCVRNGPLAPAVRFHVQNTLAKMNVVEYWTELWVRLLRRPRSILRLPRTRPTLEQIKDVVVATRDAADDECDTPNNWRSMFYTGIASSGRAIEFLTTHIRGILDGSIDPEAF